MNFENLEIPSFFQDTCWR